MHSALSPNRIHKHITFFISLQIHIFRLFPFSHESINNVFKPTIGNETLHQRSNDNGVRIVNFATSKNQVVKSMMFPHRNIHK